MEADLLRMEYVSLSQAVLWDENPKMHDVGSLSESISRNGFKDPPKFEPALNGGEGGIVEGNGRIMTLRMMFNQGMPRPRGVAEVDGEWAIPVLFGVDAASEASAQSYAISHNNITMMGGDFTPWDVARMWDADGYKDLLQSLAEADELPGSTDGDALDALLESFDPGPVELLDPSGDAERVVCPKCGHEFLNEGK